MAIHQVLEFHEKFELPDGTVDQLDYEAFKFRANFMDEELSEFVQSYANQDRVGMFDALLDLVYVAYGTALFMGITAEQWKAGMDAVHLANISKVRAKHEGESARGTRLDVVKPEGWQGPETTLKGILGL
jgi:predicted HAD superfamily Cof-like phosphohydrolase